MNKKTLALLLLLILALGLVACGGGAEEDTPEAEEPTTEAEVEEPEVDEEEQEDAEEPAAEEAFTIGVSNGFVGSEWRTQMIQNLQEANEEYMEMGVTDDLVIESADTDVQGQIQQIQNLMNRGVDAIIVNPNSQDGLNSVLEEAADAGIVVIAIDQEISAAGAYNVVIDQTEWARISARWLAEELGGEGDVVLIEGLVGHPANEARMQGVEEVFSEYPDINVAGRDAGNWDQATGQQVMSDFLASLPNIDGVWTQDGMAAGALQAVISADPDEWPVMVGEARVSYLQLWQEVREEHNPDFTSIGVVNPPGVAASGMRVAVELLQGNEIVDEALGGPFGNSLYVPIPGTVTGENFEEVYAEYEDAPGSYTLDGIITQEEAQQLMAGEVTAQDLMTDITEPGDAEEPEAEEEAAEEEEAEEPAEEEEAEAPSAETNVAACEGGPYTIGVSNGFVGSEWRTQMIQNLQEANEEYMEMGVTDDLVIESADTDVQGQIQQIQNLMNRGVDAIIVNPNSQDGLNSVLEEAADAGIVVIAIDQEISAAGAYNVVIDQTEWARISARWLAEELGGEGDVVLIEGLVGHPANEARMQGVEEVFSEYPDINVAGRDAGNWDQATGQQVMSDFLASLPNIDGVWTQDGMAAGALQAVISADPDEWPVMVGEARVSYLQLWDEVRQEYNPDFTSVGVVNPPGVAVSGMRVALEILCGGQVDESQLAGPFGNSLYVPIPYTVTEENFDEQLEEYADAAASYTLDGFITQEEAAGFMQ
ncbi:MAG: ABC transporter substrate-binding protein [bacterium]